MKYKIGDKVVLVAPGEDRLRTLENRGVKNGDQLTITGFGRCQYRGQCSDKGTCPGYIYMKETSKTTGCWSLFDKNGEAEWVLSSEHTLDAILGL